MITQLADATPVARYKVLKDLAGFSYYDDKRKVVLEDLNKNEKEEQEINGILETVAKVTASPYSVMRKTPLKQILSVVGGLLFQTI